MIKLRTSFHCCWHGCSFVLSSPHFHAQINRLTLSHVLKSAWALVRSALSQYSATHPPPSSLRKCWRSYLWGETWDQVMWRSQTVRRNGPSVGWLMRFVFSRPPLCIADGHSRNTATYVTANKTPLILLQIKTQKPPVQSSFVECCPLRPLLTSPCQDCPVSNEQPQTRCLRPGFA